MSSTRVPGMWGVPYLSLFVRRHAIGIHVKKNVNTLWTNSDGSSRPVVVACNMDADEIYNAAWHMRGNWSQ